MEKSRVAPVTVRWTVARDGVVLERNATAASPRSRRNGDPQTSDAGTSRAMGEHKWSP
jgi:hypothetical protein